MSKLIGNDIKVVLFDHDDTLVGTIGPKWDEHKFIAKTYYDKHLTDEEIKEHWGKPLNELVCLLYETDDTDQAIDYNVKHHKSYPKTLFPHTIRVLQEFREAGKQTGIITATNRFSFEYDLSSHGIPLAHLDYSQTADDTLYHKPNPKVFDPVLLWLTAQKTLPSQVVYIGDGLHDMKAALGAGFAFIGVETGLVTAEQFKEAGAKSIPTIGDLLG